MMRLQSIEFPDRLYEGLDLDTIRSLAGNAFEGCSCLASIVAACVALSYGAQKKASGSPSSLHIPMCDSPLPEEDIEDIDDDDEDFSLCRA